VSECSGNIYFNMYDLFTALFRLKANGLVLFLLFVFRLLLFVVTNGHDFAAVCFRRKSIWALFG